MFFDNKFYVKTEVFETYDVIHRTKTMFLKTPMFETHFGRLIKQHRKEKHWFLCMLDLKHCKN
jgi:hypothetical protein